MTDIPTIEQLISKNLATAHTDRMRADVYNKIAEQFYDSQPLYAIELSEKARELSQEEAYTAGEAFSYRNCGAGCFVLSRYSEAVSYLQNGLNLYVELEDKPGQASCYNILGIVYFCVGQYDSALEAQSHALMLHEDLGNKSSMASCLGNIGNIYQTVGQYDEALSHSLRAMAIQEELGDEFGVAVTANNIGGMFIRIGHLETALKYLEQSIEISRRLGKKFGMSKALRNIGQVFEQKGDYHTAIEYQAEAIIYTKELGDQQGYAVALSNMGVAYQKIDDCNTALSYHVTALKLAVQIGAKQVQVEVLKNIGDCYLALRNYPKCLEYLEKALELAEKIESLDMLVEVQFSFSKVYEALGDYKTSLRWYVDWSKTRDKILGADKQKLVAVMETRLSIEKAIKEKEIFRLRNVELTQALDELEEKRHSLAAAYHEIELQQAHSIKVNADLEIANRNLVELNKEKNELLGIVAHDLKNFITSMVISGESIRRYFDKLSREEMYRIGERIEIVAQQMMGLIRGLLDANVLESGRISFEPEKVSLTSIVQSVIDSYCIQTNKKNIKIDFENSGPQHYAFVDKERILQVVDNLISNAIKYSPSDSTVIVRVFETRGMIRCEVCDQGPGLSIEDQQNLYKRFHRLSAKPTGGEHSTGLGLANAKKLMEGMNGTIHCESILGEGATFSIECPQI